MTTLSNRALLTLAVTVKETIERLEKTVQQSGELAKSEKQTDEARAYFAQQAKEGGEDVRSLREFSNGLFAEHFARLKPAPS